MHLVDEDRSLAERAVLHAVPEFSAAEQAVARCGVLVDLHRVTVPDGDAVDEYELRMEALAVIRSGGDPAELFADAWARLSAASEAQFLQRCWSFVANATRDEVTACRSRNVDGQIWFLDREVRDLVARARTVERGSGEFAELEAGYVEARELYVQLVHRRVDPFRPVEVTRLGWLENIEDFEARHRSEVEGVALSDLGWADPWPADDAGRFRWLAATPTATPWCPTMEQLQAKTAELRVAVYGEPEDGSPHRGSLSGSLREDGVDPETMYEAAPGKWVPRERPARAAAGGGPRRLR